MHARAIEIGHRGRARMMAQCIQAEALRSMNRGEMTEPRRIDATRAPGAMQIEHCDIPAEMTLTEWRRTKADGTPGRRRRSVKQTLTGVFRRAA